MSLYLKKTPGSNGQALYEVAQGTRLEIVSVEKGWAKVVYKGDTVYAAKRHLQITKTNKETGQSALPSWVNKDEGEGKWGAMSYYFSTDRIMEALPDFGILRGKLPVDPDIFFHIAFWFLLITGILFPFIEGGIRYANALYWLTYVVALVTSACEILYLLSSPDPLGFCDINNVWFGTALFYLLLCGLALSQQMALFACILFTTQHDLDFDFKAGWGTKLSILVALYVVAMVIAYHFGEEFSVQLTAGVFGLLALPVVLLLFRAFKEREFAPVLILLPYYAIVGTATLVLMCVLGIVALILSLCIWVISLVHDDSWMYVKVGNTWYRADFETFVEGCRTGAWDDWSSRFNHSMSNLWKR